MNYKSIASIVLACLFITLTSCKVEGEQIIGIWQTQGEFEQMTIEILPWNSQFNGYLLEYKEGEKITKGERSNDNMILTDLVYQNEAYEKGTIYIDQSGDEKCNIRLQMLNENQLTATYDCDGEQYEETWTRAGHNSNTNGKTPTSKESPDESPMASETTPTDPTSTEKTKKITPKKMKKPTKSDKSSPHATSDYNMDTKPKSTFYVIGVYQVVDYDDMKALTKATDALWTKTYTDDFSSKLNNISDQESMYAVYSDYDHAKGKMTITIGYKVKDLSNVPVGLKRVKVPSNEYLTYAMSGKASDYEGEGWEQLEEMMGYRKAESADFEVYTFDSNFDIKSATMWIATK